MSVSSKGSSRIMSKLAVSCLGLLMVMSWVVAYKGNSVISQVVNIYYLNIPEHPYFQPENAYLFYVLTPAIVMSDLTLFLLPGIFWVLARGKTYSWTEMLIWAFGTSFMAYVVLISATKLISPITPHSSAFLVAVCIGGGFAWAILAYRVFRGAKLPWPISEKKDIRRLLWTVAIPVIVLLLMFPIMFWQDMHDDGIEALEIGRSLSTHFLPRFPDPTGFSGLGGGMIPMAYPVHWFVTLFGPFEASARLPMLLYLPVVFCLLIQLIELRSHRNMELKEEALLCFGLGVFTVTMSYNASYDPYFADIASPAAFETLTVLCITSAIYFLLNGHIAWFIFFALMSYLCRPIGLLFLGLLGLTIAFCLPKERRPMLTKICVAIALCLLITIVYEKVFIPSIIGDTLFGYPSLNVLQRFRYLRIDDLSRIGFVLFPSGILPLTSLLAFRWQDRITRVITIVSITFFIFFYFQANVALHHFVLIMILPLVVFWRIYLNHQGWFRSLSLPAVALTSIIAFWVSLPHHFEINRTVRGIGWKTTLLVGDYDTDYRSQVKHAELFFKLIPPDWEVKEPSVELVSGYGSLIYYSTRPKPVDTQINYIVQSLKSPAPIGFTKIADDGVAGLYVKDLEEWRQDRFRPLRTDYRSTLYDISRTTLFRHWGASQGEYSIDLKEFSLFNDLWNIVKGKH